MKVKEPLTKLPVTESPLTMIRPTGINWMVLGSAAVLPFLFMFFLA